MNKNLKVLGNGQIWDLKGISPEAKGKTFEDLFSGRALGRMAEEANKHSCGARGVLSPFKEKGKITGLSVTKALLSRRRQAKNTAINLFERLARNGALGIKALNKGTGFKENWPAQERKYWKNIDMIIIGGGASEGLTGRILVSRIKKYLSQEDLSRIRVYQAKFPGKEAGFIGAVVNIIKAICNEAKIKRLKVIAGIGLDLGREEIGVGLLGINANSGKILKEDKHYWLFKYAAKTPRRSHLKNFLDSRSDYTINERRLGESIRGAILEEMAHLIIRAQEKAQKIGLICAQNVGVAVPGSVSGGCIINSTDYLPFFRKRDRFNFAKSLQEYLAKAKSGMQEYRVHLVNDGIAAGIANAYFGLPEIKKAKFAFLGVGSGLGGCVGVAN